MPDKADRATSDAARKIRRDARGQFARSHISGGHDGVASAKPTVITGSDDATVNKLPPGQKKPEKDWDLNYDPGEMNEGRYRG